MSKCKIRIGDNVCVLVGKDRGKTGKVLKIVVKNFNTPREQTRLIVEGLNRMKKHVKPNPRSNVVGGVIEKEGSIHVSNLAIVNPQGKPDKIGFRIENGRKVRYFKSTGEGIVEQLVNR